MSHSFLANYENKVSERPIKCLSDNFKEKLKFVITHIIGETICSIIPDFIAFNIKRLHP